MKKVLVLGTFCAGLAAAQQLIQLKIANAASYQTQAGIAPRTMLSIFGQGLSKQTLIAPDPARLPTELGGVTAEINGLPAMIYSVAPDQVNILLDPATQTGEVDLAVNTPIAFAIGRMLIEPTSSPAIFTLNGKGSGDGVVVNAVTGAIGPFTPTGPTGTAFLALYVTGLDTRSTPIVRVGGLPVPVTFSGDHPTYQGLQQINVQLGPELAGLGRVEVVVEQRGRRSNAVEVVMLPLQPVFASDQPNQVRSRELGAIAWIPGQALALVADENDDVLRVLDLGSKRVTRVISLPDGSQPSAIGVWGTGDLALVALRGRDSAALVDLKNWTVAAEYPVGRSPSAIAVAQDQAVIINSDSDSATFFEFRLRQITGTAQTGRLPRAVTSDLQRIYVTNQSDGSITALDWNLHTAVSTLKLGVDVRPGAIQLIPGTGYVVVSDPSAGPDGKAHFVNLASGKIYSQSTNTGQKGGASSFVMAGEKIYGANQSGASITSFGFAYTSILASAVEPTNIATEQGTRALALDSRDNLLLALNQGTGTVSLIDVASGSVTGKIDGVRVSPGDDDDHQDRLNAPNLPRITSSLPATANGDTLFLLELAGSNFTGATAVLFIDPATVPSFLRGKGNLNRGNYGTADPGIAVSNIQVSPDGTQLTANVRVARGIATGQRLIRVLAPNGETPVIGAPTIQVFQLN
jgi:uncharacterized protein (TIGR03437 family)